MVTKKATIKNNAGIHVRPSGVIFGATRDHRCAIVLRGNGFETSLDGVMGLIAMGLCKGDVIDISVDGPDEAVVCDQLVELFERVYDFPPRG